MAKFRRIGVEAHVPAIGRVVAHGEVVEGPDSLGCADGWVPAKAEPKAPAKPKKDDD